MPVRGTTGADPGQRYGVVATRHYPSGPPAALYTDDDGEVFETVKEEEIVHRRKKATTTTRNIERRTQRDLLLRDGELVGDTGPTVTEDVTEDTQVHETFADENLKPEGQSDAIVALPPGEGWVAVPGSLVTSEKVERYVNSHQEQENTKETEQHAHYGDVTNEEVEACKGSSARLSQAAQRRREAQGKEVVLSEPRLVSETNRNWGVVDTEDVRETSRIKDGHVETETHRTTQQEQYDHGSAPDSGSSVSDGSVHEEGHKAHHHLVHTKDEDILEYYAVPKGGTLAQGVKLGEGMHVVSEDVQENREGDALETVGAGLLRHRVGPPPRQDALTKRPLDYVKEERQRQDETTRWLEHHFGSDSGRSHGSEEETSTGGNRITITMSPHPASPPPTPPQGPMRRWGPLSSTPNNKASVSTHTNNSTHNIINSTTSAPVARNPSFSGPPPPPMPHQISAARARLRSTGRTLDEIDGARDVYAGRVRTESYNSGSGGPFTPPMSPTSPVVPSSTNYTTDRYQPPVTNGNDRYISLSNVGRSQSFHTSNLEQNESRSIHPNFSTQTWQSRSRSPQPAAPPRQSKNRPLSGHFSTLQNPKKKSDRSAKLFDDQFVIQKEDNADSSCKKYTSYKSSDEKWQDKAKPSRFSWEKENNRPHSSMENGYRERNDVYANHGSTHFAAKMTGRLAAPSSSKSAATLFPETEDPPVPPPRTKRRQRPQTTYYFGQQPEITVTKSKQRPSSIYANMAFGSNATKEQDSRYNSNTQKQNSTYLNKSTSFTNGRTYENGYSNDLINKNPSRSRTESRNSRYNDNLEMNRKNDSYNHRSDSRFSNNRDNSNDRYDSGFGERQETERRQYENYSSRGEERSGRKSSDGRRYEENTVRKSSDDRKRNIRRNSKDEKYEKKGSPIVERRFKTTKTITPVFVMETKQPKQYRSMDILNSSPERNSSWTQTLESRKKVADENLRNSSTLPRKVHQSTFTLPSKTYIYGTDDKSDRGRSYNSGSMMNVTSQRDAEQYTPPSMSIGNSSKHVLRSHSLNVRPVTNLSSLRSPNLIASIARSNSTRRPETKSTDDLLSRDLYDEHEPESRAHRSASANQSYLQNNDVSEEKRSRFMEGLLNTAPELFHFMHGEGQDTVDGPNNKRSDSPPRLVRPPGSSSASPSPAPVNAPKVFTFGREGGSTLRRGSSGSGTDLNSSIPNINKAVYSTNSMSRNSSGYDSGSHSNNGIKKTGNSVYDSNNRRQSTFNMKTHGASLLYSPSFRERSQQMQQEKIQRQQDAEMAGKRAGLSAGLPRDNAPILIQVSDWNAR